MRRKQLLALSLLATASGVLMATGVRADPITIDTNTSTAVTAVYNPDATPASAAGANIVYDFSAAGRVDPVSVTGGPISGPTVNTGTTTYTFSTNATTSSFSAAMVHQRGSGTFVNTSSASGDPNATLPNTYPVLVGNFSYVLSAGHIDFTVNEDNVTYGLNATYQSFETSFVHFKVELIDQSRTGADHEVYNPAIFSQDTSPTTQTALSMGTLRNGDHYTLLYAAEIAAIPGDSGNVTASGNFGVGFSATAGGPAVPLPSTIYGGAALVGLLGCVKLRRRMRA